MEKLEEYFKSGGDEDLIVHCLAGLDSDRAWELREALLKAGATVSRFIEGLAGCDSKRAWQFRNKHYKFDVFNNSMAESLAGLDSDQAWNMRTQIGSGEVNKEALAFSLQGVDSETAWQWREKLLSQGVRRDSIVRSLSGLDSEKAWAMRTRFLKDGSVRMESILDSLVGLDSDRAWQMRDEIMALGNNETSVLVFLAGCDSERAWAIRNRFLQNDWVDEEHILDSLVGLDSKQAWQIRADFSKDSSEESVISSIGGKLSKFTWRLNKENKTVAPEANRKVKLLNILNAVEPVKIEEKEEKRSEKKAEYLSEDEILDELEKLYEQGDNRETLGRFMAGLDSDRAWKLRYDIFKNSDTADSALVEGLAGLESRRAWDLRDEYMARGGKSIVLFGSLTGCDSKRAWSFRQANLGTNNGIYDVAILNSLAGLDSEEAWKIRDEFLKTGKLWPLAASLIGLDSDRAWAYRTKLVKDGVARHFIVGSLIGLNSDRAWEMRDYYLNKNEYTGYLATSLAGLDSDRAWKMREDLIKIGVKSDSLDFMFGLAGCASERAREFRKKYNSNKESTAESTHFPADSVAASLAGTTETFLWQLNKKEELESGGAKREEEAKAEKPTEYLSEEDILDNLENYLKQGAGPGKVAGGLIGCDSERAWGLRERLIKLRVAPESIYLGLANCNSERAWEFREKCFQNEVNYQRYWAAAGLVGLDNDRAWEIRNKMNDSEYLLYSLPGCDSERAWTMRGKKMAVSGDIFLSLAGLDSERAWKMRDSLAVASTDVMLLLQGLAGLDSDRAWEFRDKYWTDSEYDWAGLKGLAGCDSKRARAKRDAFFPGNKTYLKYWLESFVGLNSKDAKIAREMITANLNEKVDCLAGGFTTFVWQLKRNKQEAKKDYAISSSHTHEVSFNESELLQKINQYLQNESLGADHNRQTFSEQMKGLIKGGKKLPFIINDVLKTAPEVLLNTLAAKKDSHLLATRLVSKAFPSTLLNEAKPWRGFSGYSGFAPEGRGEPDNSPENYLRPNSGGELWGGNPEQGAAGDAEVMRFREPINDLIVTNIYGRLNGQLWDANYQFPVARPSLEKARETTITLPQVGTQSKLPKLINSIIIPERVKGLKRGAEIKLAADISPRGDAVVWDTKKAEEIVYSLEVDEVPKALRAISVTEYENFREGFIRANGSDMTKEIVDMPAEVDIFLASVKNKEPKERVQAIEKFVRVICHYDFKNKEMMALKKGKNLDERLELMESRVDELRAQTDESRNRLAGKKYAGVCADFAVLTAAILRRAGFAAGVLEGFKANGLSARVSQAHSTAFVVWPNARKENEIFAVDGTPDGLPGISRPPLGEQERQRMNMVKELNAETLAKLDEVMKIIQSQDEKAIRELSNGTLEKVLNAVLRYNVEQENLQVITAILEAYWYTPLAKTDLSNPDGQIKFLKFFEAEIERARQEKPADAVQDPGTKLFETVEAFLQRFAKNQAPGRGFAILDKINLLAERSLSVNERKALAVTIAYLQARKVK